MSLRWETSVTYLGAECHLVDGGGVPSLGGDVTSLSEGCLFGGRRFHADGRECHCDGSKRHSSDGECQGYHWL